jgi:DNA mismatch repair protein MutL
MTDVIRLLPDALANQIAAGEVVQRPASVVKELLENAIDAGASKITLIIKEGGKSLIQVIDDGKGMSETDARLSFERHATSKINQAEDLFNIRTMGFRGEALASIAAVAQVEMKTRTEATELATRIFIEATKVIVQEPCQAPQGTSITVKNLFFNIPARKNFLKSDAREFSHIDEEFLRIAMAYPEIGFSCFNNDKEIYKLNPGNLRQRIVACIGNPVNKYLVPIEEKTDVLELYGFIGTPDIARKRRGDQYLFVNGRFIKNYYLNHAIVSAYEQILPEDHSPFYAIFLKIDPAKIDVNVHPTKQEIKFDDEKIIYHYLKVAARHALGKYHVTPVLDFDQEPAFQTGMLINNPAPPKDSSFSSFTSYRQEPANQDFDWKKLYEPLKGQIFPSEASSDHSSEENSSAIAGIPSDSGLFKDEEWTTPDPYQLHQKYILSHVRSGIMVIDQASAHERILYEKFLRLYESGQVAIQQLLFPAVLNLDPSKASILSEMLADIRLMGFDIEPFGDNSFIVHGTPADLSGKIEGSMLVHQLIEQYRSDFELKLSTKERIAWSAARTTSLKAGVKMTVEEMKDLIDQLFACEMPYNSPSGKKCFFMMDFEELDKKLNS